MLGIEADTDEVARFLREVGARLERPGPALQKIGELLGEYTAEVFATQGHGQWPALSPETERIKGHGRMLVDTGGLLDAFTHPTAIDDDTVTVTTAPPYTQYVARRRDPAPMPPDTEVEQWAELLLDYITEGRA